MSSDYGGHATTLLLPGRLRGYRQWRLTDMTGKGEFVLQAITAQTRWPWTPVVTAVCLGAGLGRGINNFRNHIECCRPEDVPAAACTCGFYAKHQPSALPLGAHPVAGVIEAWGPHTEIGDEGFRARFARIRALWLPNSIFPVVDDPGRARGWYEWIPPSERRIDPEEEIRLDDIGRALETTYRVPVYHDWLQMIDDYPPMDITELLPPKPRIRRACCTGLYCRDAFPTKLGEFEWEV